MKLNYIFLIVFFVASCNSKDNFDGIIPAKIHGTKNYIEKALDPSEICIVKDQLFCIDYSTDKMLFKIDTSFQKVVDLGIRKGRGPAEFGSIGSLQSYQEQVAFFDKDRKILWQLIGETTKEVIDFHALEISIDNISLLIDRENAFLLSGLFDNYRFAIIDSFSNIKSTYSNFPSDIEKLGYSTRDKNFACTNVLAVGGDRFANIIYDSGFIEFFKIEDTHISKVAQHQYSDFEFIIKNQDGIQSVIRSNENTGFIDIRAHNNCVYALFSTVNWNDNENEAALGDLIIRYNWQGEVLEVLQLDAKLYRFDISRSGDIYGFGFDEAGTYFAKYLPR